CSNPHPHGQIWANQTIPNEPRKEQESQKAYLENNRACLLCDYLDLEKKATVRIGAEHAHFVVVGPCHARRLGKYRQTTHFPLRQTLQCLISLFDGISSIADRWRSAPGMA